MVNRLGIEVEMKQGRDFWWEELRKQVSIECEPELVEANEPGIVFYRVEQQVNRRELFIQVLPLLYRIIFMQNAVLDHHEDDVFWCTADIGWLEFIWGIAGSLANGVTTVVVEGAIDYPSKTRYYEIIEKYRVNKFIYGTYSTSDA